MMENPRDFACRAVIRPCMLLLYAFNTFDLVLTKYLLETGRFYEINPVMALALENFYAVLLLKIILPALLLYYLDIRVFKADIRAARAVVTALIIMSAVYAAITAMHLWLLYISGAAAMWG